MAGLSPHCPAPDEGSPFLQFPRAAGRREPASSGPGPRGSRIRVTSLGGLRPCWALQGRGGHHVLRAHSPVSLAERKSSVVEGLPQGRWATLQDHLGIAAFHLDLRGLRARARVRPPPHHTRTTPEPHRSPREGGGPAARTQAPTPPRVSRPRSRAGDRPSASRASRCGSRVGSPGRSRHPQGLAGRRGRTHAELG